jgi:hypothetical protein
VDLRLFKNYFRIYSDKGKNFICEDVLLNIMRFSLGDVEYFLDEFLSEKEVV